MGHCIVALAVVLTSCRESAAPPASDETLPEDSVARVGRELVRAQTVARIAAAQSVDARAARDRAVRDALFAVYALEQPNGAELARRASRIARARAELERLEREAENQGPAMEEELDAIVRERWWELDRPELRRSVHAVVAVKDTGRDAAARALAERIEHAVRGVDSPDAFEERVKSVPAGALEVRVERLDPCTKDGRVVDPARPPPPGSETGRYSPAFAEAIFAIEDVGRTSAVFRSEFGHHVALLTERIPEHRLSTEQRREQLSAEAMKRRAAARHKSLVGDLRSRTTVEVERAALELTKMVRVAE